MIRFYKASLAAFAALFLTLGSIGAIVTLPPAEAATPAVLTMPALA